MAKITIENFRLDVFLKTVLRGAFKKYPHFNEVKRRAKREYFVQSKTGKPMRRVCFQCAGCGRYFLDVSGELAVDHRNPVGEFTTVEQLPGYILGLFCDISNLDLLCNYPDNDTRAEYQRSCHRIKSAKEAAERATKPTKKTAKKKPKPPVTCSYDFDELQKLVKAAK